MTTSHRCHRKRVTLVELHRLRYPRVLLFPPEAAACPLSPGVHLAVWGERERARRLCHCFPKPTAQPTERINPHKSFSDSSVSPAVEEKWLNLKEVKAEQRLFYHKETLQAWLPPLDFSLGSQSLAQCDISPFNPQPKEQSAHLTCSTLILILVARFAERHLPLVTENWNMVTLSTDAIFWVCRHCGNFDVT